jgi:hypothetical protein
MHSGGPILPLQSLRFEQFFSASTQPVSLSLIRQDKLTSLSTTRQYLVLVKSLVEVPIPQPCPELATANCRSSKNAIC